MIERLPYWGHYKTTLSMDVDWANMVLDMEEAGRGAPTGSSEEMSPLGYNDIVARLDLIADRVMGVRTAIQAGNSEKGEEPHFEPMKRPVTALDKERERRARKVLLEVEADLFSGGLDLQVFAIE